MASRFLRSLVTTKQSIASVFAHSYTTASAVGLPNSSSFIFRIRPLVAAAPAFYFRRLVPVISTRAFSTRHTTSSLNDPNPNWSNRPPKETILLDGCDFEHWLVVVDPPQGDPTRDEIIDSYIKTLAKVIGSEEEARMKIYSVSTRHYYAFGALVSEEVSYKIKELPGVRWVLPDSYLDVKNKDYGGEPFINGQAVPYDPKYHEEWVRNNARANERNRRNDRPRNFDRSRNFERRREMQNQNSGPNAGVPGGNYRSPPPATAPNSAPMQPNMGGQPNYGGGVPPNNPGNYPANNVRGPASNAPNYQYGPGPNSGGAPAPYQPGPGLSQSGFPTRPGQAQDQNAYAPPQNQNAYTPPQNQNAYTPQNQNYPNASPNSFTPNRGFGPTAQNSGHLDPNAGYGDQNNFTPNMGPGQRQNQNAYAPPQNQNAYAPPQNQNAYAPPQNQNAYTPPQNQNVSGRDFPPPNY